MSTIIDNQTENIVIDMIFVFNKIIKYHKSHNSSNSLIKSLLEEEYRYQQQLSCEAFDRVYPKLSEQDQFLATLFHNTLIEKLDSAFINACTKLTH